MHSIYILITYLFTYFTESLSSGLQAKGSSCEPRWIRNANLHSLNAVHYPKLRTVGSCLDFCQDASDCIAVDFHTIMASSFGCWLHRELANLLPNNTFAAPYPITQYILDRACLGKECAAEWRPIPKTTSNAGLHYFQFRTIEECQRLCLRSPGCQGLDFDTRVNEISGGCYIYYYKESLVKTYKSRFVEQYRLTKKVCGTLSRQEESPSCSYTWSTPIKDQNVEGAVAYVKASTLGECQAHCIRMNTCTGVDISTKDSTIICRLSMTKIVLSPLLGVTHYKLIRGKGCPEVVLKLPEKQTSVASGGWKLVTTTASTFPKSITGTKRIIPTPFKAIPPKFSVKMVTGPYTTTKATTISTTPTTSKLTTTTKSTTTKTTTTPPTTTTKRKTTKSTTTKATTTTAKPTTRKLTKTTRSTTTKATTAPVQPVMSTTTITPTTTANIAPSNDRRLAFSVSTGANVEDPMTTVPLNFINSNLNAVFDSKSNTFRIPSLGIYFVEFCIGLPPGTSGRLSVETQEGSTNMMLIWDSTTHNRTETRCREALMEFLSPAILSLKRVAGSLSNSRRETMLNVFSVSNAMSDVAQKRAVYAVTVFRHASCGIVPMQGTIGASSGVFNRDTYSYLCASSGLYLFTITGEFSTKKSSFRLSGLLLNYTLSRGPSDAASIYSRAILSPCDAGMTVFLVGDTEEFKYSLHQGAALSAFPYIPRSGSPSAWALVKSHIGDMILDPFDFNLITYNNDGLWNPRSRTVTIKSPGYYYVYFSFGISSQCSLDMTIQRNGAAILGIFLDSCNGAEDEETVGRGIVVVLKANDVLKVVGKRPSTPFTNKRGHMVTFFGMRLY